MFGFDSDIVNTVVRGLVLGPIALVWAIFVVRAVGLRSFSKMAPFDFVVTVATGSLLASAATASTWPGFVQASIGISALLGFQFMIAKLRMRSPEFRRLSENTPTVLMSRGTYYRDLMREVRVTESDIRAKLREANAPDASAVGAVVLETTGDISVLQDNRPSDDVMKGTRGADRLS